MTEPANLTARVEGIPENVARLQAIGRDVHRMEATHRAIAELVRPAAAALVPNTSGRGTGYLAASLVPAADDAGGRLESDARYAALIEARYGYVSRAIAEHEAELLARYEQGLAEVIGRNS